MKIDPQRVLVLSPHCDDAEVSSGGAIARFLREGREVHVLVLGLAAGASPSEFEAGMAQLGVPKENCYRRGFPVRTMMANRQEILDLFLAAAKMIQPDLVIAPSLRDMHQDHQVVAQEALRAFKNGCTVLGWEYPWNALTFNTSCFIEITEADMERKIAAIQEYHSQAKDYMRPEFIRAWAITNGVAIKAPYAECFEVARLIC